MYPIPTVRYPNKVRGGLVFITLLLFQLTPIQQFLDMVNAE